MFIKGCLTGQGATRSICECMSERAEQKLPSWEVPLSSFELLAGRKSRTDIGKLLAKEEYVSCFARDDVPWGDDGRERLLKRCETSTIPAEICPCYVDRIISTTKLSDVARSDLPGDAGALANALFERRAAEAIRACLRPAKASAKKKRR
jgi:hypothetical protein